MVDHKVEPRGPGHVLLILRLEGISLEEYNKVPEDKLGLQVGGGHSTPVFRTSSAATTTFKDGKPVKTISPWIIIAFSIPQDATSMKLTVGDFAPVTLKVTGEILERLSTFDL